MSKGMTICLTLRVFFAREKNSTVFSTQKVVLCCRRQSGMRCRSFEVCDCLPTVCEVCQTCITELQSREFLDSLRPRSAFRSFNAKFCAISVRFLRPVDCYWIASRIFHDPNVPFVIGTGFTWSKDHEPKNPIRLDTPEVINSHRAFITDSEIRSL